MPFLLDDDLLFDDDAGPRPTTAVNQWLRELPSSGCPAPSTWATYARVLRDWMVYLAAHDIELFGERATLREALSGYVFRTVGPLKTRLGAASWNLHVSVLSRFYRWAVDEDHALAEPFTYRLAR
jgi:site-specific recombinase XerD